MDQQATRILELLEAAKNIDSGLNSKIRIYMEQTRKKQIFLNKKNNLKKGTKTDLYELIFHQHMDEDHVSVF